MLVPGLNVDLCALFIIASTTPLHTPRDSGSEPGYGPIRSSDHSPVDPLPERRPPALPYGDPGLVTVGALARISRSGVSAYAQYVLSLLVGRGSAHAHNVWSLPWLRAALVRIRFQTPPRPRQKNPNRPAEYPEGKRKVSGRHGCPKSVI